MATEIYLGNPPQYVIDWIKAHSKPAANPKTKITFADGSSQEYDWSGTIDMQMMIDAELYNGEVNAWQKSLQNVEIGSKVTRVEEYTFLRCYGLKNITIGNGVTSIGAYAFAECNDLNSATIPDSVTIIGEGTFDQCDMLKNVTIIANGGDAAKVKRMMIDAGVSEYSTWNMPS